MTLLPKLALLSLLGSTAAFAADPIALFPGWPTKAGPEHVLRFRVEDPSVAQAEVASDGRLVITGLREGVVRVSVWTAGSATPSTVEARVETAGWDLVEVMVAAHDIPEGTRVTEAMTAARKVPRVFVSSSIVKAVSVQYVIGQLLLVPVQAGDFLLWSAFETMKK